MSAPAPAGYDVFVRGDPAMPAADGVLAAWRAAGMPDDVARERIDQVVAVATSVAGEVAGVVTAVAAKDTTLGERVWHLRVLVMPAHRRHGVRTGLLPPIATAAIEHLEGRFVAGTDTSVKGVLYAFEHPRLARYFDATVNTFTAAVFCGLDPSGQPRFVRWFPGALLD